MLREADVYELRPLLRVCLLLILGLLVGSRFPALTAWCNQWVVLGVVFLILLLRNTRWCGVLLYLAVFLMGIFLFHAKERRTTLSFPSTPMAYEAVVLSRPQQNGKVLRMDLLVKMRRQDGRWQTFKARAALLHDTLHASSLPLKVGSGLRAWSVMRPPENFGTATTFDYRRWMRTHGYLAQTFIYYSDWQPADVSLRSFTRLERLELSAMMMRERLGAMLKAAGIERRAESVLAAMTIGDKGAIDRDTRTLFSVTGVSHLLALSGLHLSVLYAFLMLFMPRRRWIFLSRALVVLAIWAYAFMTGLSSSVVRAALMLTIYGALSVFNRDRASVNALALAALVMLVANPFYLWDLSFRLSFLSVLGILWFYPFFFALLMRPFRRADDEFYAVPDDERQWRGRPLRRLWSKLAALMSVSLSAQLMTLPLVLYHFSTFSAYFLLANLVAVPLATLMIYLAVGFFLVRPWPWLSGLSASVLSLLAGFQIRFLQWIASLPGASFFLPLPARAAVLLLIAVLFAGWRLDIYRVRHQREWRLKR